MTDQQRHPETSDDNGARYERESTVGMPRWVRLAAIIVAVVALLVVIVLLIGGGHGPRRHGVSGDVRGQVPAASQQVTHLLTASNE